MGFRIRKNLTLLPGLRVNLSKSGASLSVGKRGATINIGRKGARSTIGVPGSGVSYSSYEPYEKKSGQNPESGRSGWFWPVTLAVAVILVLALV